MFTKLRSITRKGALWLLRNFGPGDISIRHHYTGDRFTLNAFKHKGYWFHGKRRERHTMNMLRQVVSPGDTVLDAGAHIGYLTIYFAGLVGPNGSVFAFEPDPANGKYLRRNVLPLPQVLVVDKAIASSSGPRDFYVENLSGQNNSLYSDFKGFGYNSSAAGYDAGGYRCIGIEATSIDDFCRDARLQPDFIKIDIEGAEWEALLGMEQTAVQGRPRLMVEVGDNKSAVFDWMRNHGYLLYNEQRQRLREPNDSDLNIFCLHREAHREWLDRIGLDTTGAFPERNGQGTS
jgi:FkbM family methyltransferase